jgi:hypothetical protein
MYYIFSVKKNHMYTLDLLTVKDFSIVKESEKTVYNTDGMISLSEWIRVDDYPTTDTALPTTNGLNIPNNDYDYKKPNQFIGYLHDHSNNVQYNTKGVGMYSTIFSGTHGLYVTEINFERTICGFSARRIIQSEWYNQKDEYVKPNIESVEYTQYYLDSIIYSLFNNASFQSSLRQVEYKDKLWDIKNEFFWMSKDRMKELANKNGYYTPYNDARTSDDRHVYKLLFGEERIYDKLSPDARAVLDKATELVEKSMELRRVMANDEYYHLDSWDAGYVQLKLIWKDYFQEDFKEFRQLYKNLEDRMRPLVYELGFLIK